MKPLFFILFPLILLGNGCQPFDVPTSDASQIMVSDASQIMVKVKTPGKIACVSASDANYIIHFGPCIYSLNSQVTKDYRDISLQQFLDLLDYSYIPESTSGTPARLERGN